MFPNENYLIHYGAEKIEQLPQQTPFSDTLSVGSFFALNKIIENIGFDVILNKLFDENARFIQALITYYIDDRSGVNQHFERYAFNNVTMLKSIPSVSTISKITNDDFSFDLTEKFLELWNEQIIELQDGSERTIISIDSTNFNTHSKNMDIAEYGLPKVNEGLPQLNLSYALRQKDGLPLFYDLYPGSISDVSNYKFLLEKAKRYDYKNVVFVLDRGYFSEENIQNSLDNDFDVIVMAKSWNKRLNKHWEEIRHDLKDNSKNFIRKHGINGRKDKLQIYNNLSREFYVYNFYNEQSSLTKNKEFDFITDQLEGQLKNLKLVTEEIKRQYRQYFTFNVDENNALIDYEINYEERDKYRQKTGYFSIVTNLDLDIVDVLDIYKKRNSIEKAFKMLKTDLDVNKFRVHNETSLKFKLFIAFSSAIIRSQFAHLNKELLKLSSSDTVNTLFTHLSKIQVTRNSQGYARKYALTAKQKLIFKHLNLSENELDKFVKKVNDFYSGINIALLINLVGNSFTLKVFS